VRTTYWKVYNNTYIGSQMCLPLPDAPDEPQNSYRRAELDVFI
jgi:hypothetical protein